MERMEMLLIQIKELKVKQQKISDNMELIFQQISEEIIIQQQEIKKLKESVENHPKLEPTLEPKKSWWKRFMR